MNGYIINFHVDRGTHVAAYSFHLTEQEQKDSLLAKYPNASNVKLIDVAKMRGQRK